MTTTPPRPLGLILFNLWLLLAAAVPGFAQSESAVAEAPATVRRFDSTELNRLLQDDAFDYDREEAPDEPSTSDAAWDEFNKWLRSLFGDSEGGTALRWIIISACVVLVGFIVFRFVGTDMRLLSGRGAAARINYKIEDEDIHEMDFEKLIEAAKAASNYKRSLRLLYLQALKQMTDKGLIRWQPNKTNNDYRYELAGTRLEEPFADATPVFDRLFYGDRPLDRTEYDQAELQFRQLSAAIKAA